MGKPIRKSTFSAKLKEDDLHESLRLLYLYECQSSGKLEKGMKKEPNIKKKIKKIKKKIYNHPSNSEIPTTKIIKSETKSIEKKSKKYGQANLKQRRKKRLQAQGIDEGEIQTLNWEILPSGKWTHFEAVLKDLLNQRKWDEVDNVKVAKERYERIFELKPTKVFQGYQSFSNYFAFHYNDTKKVVLESMIYGNATYIIEGDWKTLSQKTKEELKVIYKVEVIHHNPGWFSKLKNSLQIGFE